MDLENEHTREESTQHHPQESRRSRSFWKDTTRHTNTLAKHF